MHHAASWSFAESDARQVDEALRSLLEATGARRALLIDRAGQLVAAAGALSDVDLTTFASLAAADFAANEQVASLLGERDFSSLFHQGDPESVYLVGVERRAILVVMFGRSVTLGLVRIKARPIVRELDALFAEAFARPRPASSKLALEPTWAAEAEGEIDRLFGGL